MKTALEKTLAESFVELRLSRNRHLQGMRLESSAAGLFVSSCRNFPYHLTAVHGVIREEDQK